jgi:hypothetical protein
MRKVFIKDVNSSLQKTINWFKKFGKGRHEWARSCKDRSFHLGKLNIFIKTWFASKVILFKETLEFKDHVNICHSKQNIDV